MRLTSGKASIGDVNKRSWPFCNATPVLIESSANLSNLSSSIFNLSSFCNNFS